MARPARLLTGVILLLALGCGGGDRKEGLAPVSGRITFQGQPVPAGSVTFFPIDGKRSSSGAIGSDGKYELNSFKPGDGAVIGKHKVVVNATQAGPPLPNPDTLDGKSPPPKPPARILSPQYYDRDKTPLEAEVKDENNVLDFNITK